MFTGIINYKGTIAKIEKNKKGATLTSLIPKSLGRYIKIGSSLSHNGVCLTVLKKRSTTRGLHITTFLMNETLRLTSFADARVGDIINLEPSLRLGDEIGGHFMFGHVDGIGKITSLKKDGGSIIMTLQLPKKIMPYTAVKGSIGIEGISLTIVKRTSNSISVSLIPHTLKVTNLKNKLVGDALNIEVDMLARYVIKKRGGS